MILPRLALFGACPRPADSADLPLKSPRIWMALLGFLAASPAAAAIENITPEIPIAAETARAPALIDAGALTLANALSLAGVPAITALSMADALPGPAELPRLNPRALAFAPASPSRAKRAEHDERRASTRDRTRPTLRLVVSAVAHARAAGGAPGAAEEKIVDELYERRRDKARAREVLSLADAPSSAERAVLSVLRPDAPGFHRLLDNGPELPWNVRAFLTLAVPRSLKRGRSAKSLANAIKTIQGIYAHPYLEPSFDLARAIYRAPGDPLEFSRAGNRAFLRVKSEDDGHALYELEGTRWRLRLRDARRIRVESTGDGAVLRFSRGSLGGRWHRLDGDRLLYFWRDATQTLLDEAVQRVAFGGELLVTVRAEKEFGADKLLYRIDSEGLAHKLMRGGQITPMVQGDRAFAIVQAKGWRDFRDTLYEILPRGRARLLEKFQNKWMIGHVRRDRRDLFAYVTELDETGTRRYKQRLPK